MCAILLARVIPRIFQNSKSTTAKESCWTYDCFSSEFVFGSCLATRPPWPPIRFHLGLLLSGHQAQNQAPCLRRRLPIIAPVEATFTAATKTSSSQPGGLACGCGWRTVPCVGRGSRRGRGCSPRRRRPWCGRGRRFAGDRGGWRCRRSGGRSVWHLPGLRHRLPGRGPSDGTPRPSSGHGPLQCPQWSATSSWASSPFSSSGPPSTDGHWRRSRPGTDGTAGLPFI